MSDQTLPDGWRILTAYQKGADGLVGTVGATDSTEYQCTLYPKDAGPVAATGKTPKEAIENAERKVAEVVGNDAPNGHDAVIARTRTFQSLGSPPSKPPSKGEGL